MPVYKMIAIFDARSAPLLMPGCATLDASYADTRVLLLRWLSMPRHDYFDAAAANSAYVIAADMLCYIHILPLMITPLITLSPARLLITCCCHADAFHCCYAAFFGYAPAVAFRHTASLFLRQLMVCCMPPLLMFR